MTAENGYRQLFQNYIAVGVETSLAHVREVGDELAETERQQAWHTLSYALAVDDAWPSVRDLLLALAPVMASGGYWTEWIPYLERGLSQSRALGDERAEAEISLRLGHLQHRLGHLEDAERYVHRAECLFAQQGKHYRQRTALNRRAEIFRARREFDAADRLADRALELTIVDAKDRDDEAGHSYLIKGRIAFDRQQWRNAGRHFEDGLQIYEDSGNSRRIAVCTQNLGRVRMMVAEYDEAETYFRRAIRLLQKANDSFNQAVVQMNLGIVHSLCGRPLAALESYAKAEHVFRRLHERANLAKVYNNQGMEMNNLKRWTEAEELLTASSALCLELGDLQNYINAQDSLGLTYMGTGDYTCAVCVYQEALALSRERIDQNFAASTLSDLAEHLQQALKANEAHSQRM